MLEILQYPNTALREKAKPITSFDEKLSNLSNEMMYTMIVNKGIGLAGNQVGVLERIIVLVCPEFVGAMINPEILSYSEKQQTKREGCLSFKDQFLQIKRPYSIKIKYQDLLGAFHEQEFTGITARCIQHEVNHLDGIVFKDLLKE